MPTPLITAARRPLAAAACAFTVLALAPALSPLVLSLGALADWMALAQGVERIGQPQILCQSRAELTQQATAARALARPEAAQAVATICEELAA